MRLATKAKKSLLNATQADALCGRVTTALGMAWAEIRARHPELPPAVVILASGADRQRPRWGHWSASRWAVDGTSAGEVLIAGELLAPGGGNHPDLPVSERVLSTLLHEGAHALAFARAVQDTSRDGRYHNTRYRDLAIEIGLDCEQSAPYGWTRTRITEAARQEYASVLRQFNDVLCGHRVAERRGKRTKARNGWVRASCSCTPGRLIRGTKSGLLVGPITCGNCGHDFRADSPSSNDNA